jgi:pyruvate/2-oxoglutarate dehydrogenase complex dihydrolipoamide acyltransferase (E2) component
VAKIEFVLPDVGEGLEEGEIVSWLVAPGDTVDRDQPLVEVQTDKALVELPSPVSGQIVSLAFSPGDIVKVGQVLVVLEDGRGGDTAPSSPPPATTSAAASPASAASPAAADLAPQATPPPVEAASIGAAPPSSAAVPAGGLSAGRPKAAPAVRKLAVDRGVDLASVTGTGPGGRILAADVEAAAGSTSSTGVHVIPSRAMTAVRNAGSAGGIGWMEPGRHPLRGIRRVTAETMARSWSEIPHLTTLDEIDATGLLSARKRLADAGIDATIGALLVAAVARGLRRYPVFNASLELSSTDGAGAAAPEAPTSGSVVGRASAASAEVAAGGSAGGGSIVVHPDCNIGLAVATADGLVVPVIRQADRRSLADLAAEVRRLTAAARNRRVEMAELRGGTFTISNWGAIGGRYATPLIRPPEVGIMGFGAIQPRPFVVDGEVRARPTLPWSLSADHRLIDGDVSTAFSEYVTGLLADPVALLAELLGAATPEAAQ